LSSQATTTDRLARNKYHANAAILGASRVRPRARPGTEISSLFSPLSVASTERELNVKALLRLLLAVGLTSLSFSAFAQAPPPGSYQQSCRDIRMQGPTLSALCRRANGRGEQLTALNVAHCVGDIGNNNGQLICNGGQPASPVPPPSRQGASPTYPGPGYPPPSGYPAQGYGPPPRYSGEYAYRERCEGLRHEEHELRDRLAYTPYGEERERLQYRLGQVHTEREHCWRR
jgi:hypothetical protein